MDRKLYKSSNDKILAGVCGGIGEYFAMDAVIVRLLWVVFTLMGGAGLVAYIIAAIIVPENPSRPPLSNDFSRTGYGTDDYGAENYNNKKRQVSRNGAVALGIFFILLGGFVFMRNFIPWIPNELILAVSLILLGVFFLLRRNK